MALIQGSDYRDFVLEEETLRFMKKNKLKSKNGISQYDEQLIKDFVKDEGFQRKAEVLLREFKEFTPYYDRENPMIFQYFPLGQLKKKEQCLILRDIQNLKEIPTVRETGEATSQRNAVGNKVFSNLKKVNFNLPDSRFDQILPKKIPESPFIAEEKSIKTLFRLQIINTPKSEMEKTKEQLCKVIENHCQLTAKNEDVFSIYSLSNIVLDGVFKSLFYWVEENLDLSEEEKADTFTKVEEKMDEILRSFGKKKLSRTMKPINALRIFWTILKVRNTMEQYRTLTTNLLTEEKYNPKLFQEVEEKYRVQCGQKLKNPNKLHVVLYEGGRKGESFPEQLEMTYQLMEKMSENKMRELHQDDILDVKVVFREVFISKLKHERGVTPSTLGKKYIVDPSHLSMQEKKFLREKIHRGFYRERHSLTLYHQLNDLKYKIYLCIMESLLSYDVKTICATLHNVFSSVLEVCQKSVEESVSLAKK